MCLLLLFFLSERNLILLFQSPNHGDSDITDGEQEKDLKKKKPNKAPIETEKEVAEPKEIDPNESDSSKYKRIHENREKEDKRKKKSNNGPKEVEESIEAIGAYVSGNLSDESNTASLPGPQSLPGASIRSLESAPLSFANLSNSRPDLSEDSESSNSDSSSDSDDDMEEEEEDEKTEAKIQSNPTTFRKERSFVESFLTVESNSKDSKAGKISPDFSSFSFVKTAPPKEKTLTPPRKPRRVALTTFKRKSPIKNGATSFESANDAHNLDKVTGGDSSKVFESGTLGKEASFDLGLEVSWGSVEKKALKDVSVISTRKSPRKRHSGTLEPKKLQPDQLTEGKEVELQFSPAKAKRAKQSEEQVTSGSKTKTSDSFGSRATIDTKEKETLVKGKKDELAASKRKSSEKAVAPQLRMKDNSREKMLKSGESLKQSLQDSAAANFLKSLEPSGKRMARIPKIPKKSETANTLKSPDNPEPKRKSSRTSPQKAAPKVTKAVTPKKKRDAKPVSLFEKTAKASVTAKSSPTLGGQETPSQTSVDQLAVSAAEILSNLTKHAAVGKEVVAATTKEAHHKKATSTSSRFSNDKKEEEGSNPKSKSQKPSVVKATEKSPDKNTVNPQGRKISKETVQKETQHPQGWKVSSFLVFNNKMPFGVFEEDLKDTS